MNSQFSPTDSPLKTFPIREQQMDKVTEGSELPVPRLRPHGLPRVGPSGDYTAAYGDPQLQAEIVRLR